MYYCYLLFSEKLSRYYIGSTKLMPEERLERHLSSYYGNTKYTALTDDWVLFHVIECQSNDQALKIEKHVKRVKNKVYNNNLKKYSDISKKLLAKNQ